MLRIKNKDEDKQIIIEDDGSTHIIGEIKKKPKEKDKEEE